MTPTPLSDREFDRLARSIHGLTGVTVDDTKRSMISSRVRRRLRALELETFSEYIEMLSAGKLSSEEIESFVEAVTTHKTSFFRTPSIWNVLREEFERLSAEGRSIEAWSAACSTGEEPHSLAMMLRAVTKGGARWRVTGSDVSPLTVETARAGSFDEEQVRAAATARPDADVLACFDFEDGRAQATRELGRSMRFGVHNLLDPQSSRFDVALLRNVIIYFSEDDTRRVVDHVVASLAPEGLLVIGESESLLGRDDGLEYLAPCIYRKSA